jgi:hypothetical protein
MARIQSTKLNLEFERTFKINEKLRKLQEAKRTTRNDYLIYAFHAWGNLTKNLDFG